MDPEAEYLFDVTGIGGFQESGKTFKPMDMPPIWTRNKARFIARYLKTFTFVTKHGTYIDAFAGPQHIGSKDTSWAAKLVMENEPPRLRNFFLFELQDSKVKQLQKLRRRYASEHPKHTVEVTAGDCNVEIPKWLQTNPIREKEATFCLFDQRTTECDWNTVRAVANYKGKKGGNKIELFYFLAQSWIDRALKSRTRNVEERCLRWWGKLGAFDFLKLASHSRGQLMAERFQSELGYKFAYPFPIQEEGAQGRIMFWMIHASDHDRAPELMKQAYWHIGAGGGLNDPDEQLKFWQ